MKRKTLAVLLLLLSLFGFLTYRFCVCFPLCCDEYAKTDAKVIMGSFINNYIGEYLVTSGVCYDDYCKLTYYPDNSLSGITVDGIKLTRLATDIANSIYESLKNIPKGTLHIPLGNALGSRLFSGKGFSINITTLPFGSVVWEPISEFSSAGINQTCHRIGLRFKATVVLMAPFHKSTSELDIQLTIAENVIIGKVPSLYLSGR